MPNVFALVGSISAATRYSDQRLVELVLRAIDLAEIEVRVTIVGRDPHTTADRPPAPRRHRTARDRPGRRSRRAAPSPATTGFVAARSNDCTASASPSACSTLPSCQYASADPGRSRIVSRRLSRAASGLPDATSTSAIAIRERSSRGFRREAFAQLRRGSGRAASRPHRPSRESDGLRPIPGFASTRLPARRRPTRTFFCRAPRLPGFDLVRLQRSIGHQRIDGDGLSQRRQRLVVLPLANQRERRPYAAGAKSGAATDASSSKIRDRKSLGRRVCSIRRDGRRRLRLTPSSAACHVGSVLSTRYAVVRLFGVCAAMPRDTRQRASAEHDSRARTPAREAREPARVTDRVRPPRRTAPGRPRSVRAPDTPCRASPASAPRPAAPPSPTSARKPDSTRATRSSHSARPRVIASTRRLQRRTFVAERAVNGVDQLRQALDECVLGLSVGMRRPEDDTGRARTSRRK